MRTGKADTKRMLPGPKARRESRRSGPSEDSNAAAQDQELLLAAAFNAFRELVARHEAVGLAAPPAAQGEPVRPVGGLEPEMEPMRVQNCGVASGQISIGGGHVQLEPGQEITLWLQRGAEPLGSPLCDPHVTFPGADFLISDEALLA